MDEETGGGSQAGGIGGQVPWSTGPSSGTPLSSAGGNNPNAVSRFPSYGAAMETNLSSSGGERFGALRRSSSRGGVLYKNVGG